MIGIQKHAMQKMQLFGTGFPRPRCSRRTDTSGSSISSSLCRKQGKVLPSPCFVQASFQKPSLSSQQHTQNSIHISPSFKKLLNIESLEHQNLQIYHICSMPQLAHIFSKVQKEHRCANEYEQRNANQAQDES